MTVKEFVEKYKKLTNDNAREKFVSERIKYKNYISFNEKVVLCEQIVRQTSIEIIKDSEGKEIDRKYKINSPARFLFSTMEQIRLYTNLEFPMTEALENYDLLNEYGLIDILISKIPAKEQSEFVTVLNMTMDDFMQNNISIESSLSMLVDRFKNIDKNAVSPILKVLSNKLEFDNLK